MNSLSNIKLWVIDVDGTLTDGGIYYDEHGNEMKKFSTKDAAGFFALHELNIKTMILTGRKCVATERRAKELKVDYIEQDVKDKILYLQNFLNKNQMQFNQVAYIGDDLNDFAVMSRCGFKGCPADSCREIRDIADYISPITGGQGVARDIIEFVLREQRLWEQTICKIYCTSGG